MSDCNDKEFIASENIIADATYIPECGPATVLPIPDELREPKGEFTPETPELTPPGIRVYNHYLYLNCQNGSIGEVVEIAENLYSTVVYYSGVIAIEPEILTYIAKNNLTPIVETEYHNGTLSAKRLKQLTGIKLKHGKELIALLDAAQKEMDKAARLAGEGLLYCYWLNNEQTAECEDPEMAKEWEHVEAKFSTVIPAGTVRSTVSQEDADRQAKELAIAELNCFYINDPFVALCEERPTRPMEVMEPVPNDKEPIYPGRPLRIGRFVVPAGAVTSTYSKEDANKNAQDYGYSMLVCWYPNDQMEVKCESETARDPGVLPWEHPAHSADLDTRTKGQFVTIPKGYFISDLSVSDANEMAIETASSLLTCCYVNDDLLVECDEEDVVLEDGTVVTVPASPDHGVSSVFVPAGTYTSCISEEDANFIAYSTTIGQLNCIYCNLQVMPHCVPDWIVEGIEAGDIELPLKGPTISYGDNSINIDDLPPEATLGMKADAFCTTDAQQSQTLAESASRAAQDGDSGCIYYNDEIVLSCASWDPYDESNEEHWEPNTVHAGINDEGDPYYFWTMYHWSACISEQSTPKPKEYIIIPPGTFTAYGEENKEKANRKAIEFGMSFVRCTWASPPLIGMCGGDNYVKSLCDESWMFSKNPASWNNQLAGFSNGPKNPIQLSKGMFEYVGAGNDYELAFQTLRDEAQSFIESFITCIYYNQYKEAGCDTDYSIDIPQRKPDTCGPYSTYHEEVHELMRGIVDQMTVYAESPVIADAIAEEYALNMAACTKISWETFDCVGEECPDVPPPSPTPTPPEPPEPPEPPQPDDPEPEGCCVQDCPYYGEFQDETSGENDPANAVNLVGNWKLTLEMQSTNIDNELDSISQTLDSLDV